MKDKIIYKCPKCDGKGTIFNKFSLLLTVAFPIAWLADDGDGSGLTRDVCPKCDGEGIIIKKI